MAFYTIPKRGPYPEVELLDTCPPDDVESTIGRLETELFQRGADLLQIQVAASGMTDDAYAAMLQAMVDR
jgi:hypothetical protein